MKDTPFLDLTTKNSIENINIDKRLIPIFNLAMFKIQNYFDALGYTNIVNYTKLFQNYLSSKVGFRNLSIVVGSMPKYLNAGGVYSYYNNKITINRRFLKDAERIEKTLIHEFIHFLTMHDLEVGEIQNIHENKVFLNEGLTEILTSKILGRNPIGYEAQVSLTKLYLNMFNEDLILEDFLKGKLDPPILDDDWYKFLEHSNYYHNFTNKGGYKLDTAMFNQHFVAAQNHLVNYVLNNTSINNYDDYYYLYTSVDNAPARHVPFIIDKLIEINNTYIKNNNLEEINELVNKKLNEIHNYSKSLKKYNEEDVIEYEMAGERVAISKSGAMYASPMAKAKLRIIKKSEYLTRIVNYEKPSEFLDIDFRYIDFNKRKNEIYYNINNLESIFSDYLEPDYELIKNISMTRKNIVKMEQFTMPMIDFKKSNIPNIYLIHYKDQVELVGDFVYEGVINNISANIVTHDGRLFEDAYKIKEGLVFKLTNYDEKLVLSERNNVFSLSILHNNKANIAFSDVFYDINKEAKLNDIVDELAKTRSNIHIESTVVNKKNNILEIKSSENNNKVLFEYQLVLKQIQRLKVMKQVKSDLNIKDELKELEIERKYLENKLSIDNKRNKIRDFTISNEIVLNYMNNKHNTLFIDDNNKEIKR